MTIKTEFDKTPESVLEKEALTQQEPDDYASAKRLAETIYRRHYRAEAPNWEPLPNISAPLARKKPQASKFVTVVLSPLVSVMVVQLT